MTELNVENNMIEELGSLEGFPNLKKLRASNNMLQRFQDIQSIGGSDRLSRMMLDGNPIAK